MSIDTIDAENTKPEPETGRPKGRPKATKEANPAKKATRAKNAAAKPKAERTNKKGDVIALMKRAKGAKLAEIMKETGWQAHTVRGFMSVLGKKGDEKIESSIMRSGRADVQDRQIVRQGNRFKQTPLPIPTGRRFAAWVAYIVRGPEGTSCYAVAGTVAE
jgi:hypothetical protein